MRRLKTFRSSLILAVSLELAGFSLDLCFLVRIMPQCLRRFSLCSVHYRLSIFVRPPRFFPPDLAPRYASPHLVLFPRRFACAYVRGQKPNQSNRYRTMYQYLCLFYSVPTFVVALCPLTLLMPNNETYICMYLYSAVCKSPFKRRDARQLVQSPLDLRHDELLLRCLLDFRQREVTPGPQSPSATGEG